MPVHFVGMSVLAILGAVFLGFGLFVTTMNLVTVVRNHTAKRGHWSQVFFVPAVLYVSAALTLGRLYSGWSLVAGLLALIVLSEGLPIFLANALVGWVRRRGEKLEGAELSGASLQGRYLRGARLRGAKLQRADLRQADLRDADLSNADLSGADLFGASLAGATLDGANLDDADLTETEIYRASHAGAHWNQQTKWPASMGRIGPPGRPSWASWD